MEMATAIKDDPKMSINTMTFLGLDIVAGIKPKANKRYVIAATRTKNRPNQKANIASSSLEDFPDFLQMVV